MAHRLFPQGNAARMADRLPELMGHMAVFARVAEMGNFSAAARALGLTKSAVSKQVARLEAVLGTQLLRRTTRGASLTEPGQALYERVVQAIELCLQGQSAVSQLRAAPQGLLKVTAPLSYGKRRVAPLLPAFLAAYPDITVQLVLVDRTVDLAEEGIDLAFRLSRAPAGHLVARKLHDIGYAVCCAPALLHGVAPPKTPAGLAALNCLRYEGGEAGSTWRFTGPRGTKAAARVDGNLLVNSSELLRDAALQGGGVALLPDFLVDEDLRAGQLVPLLARWTAQPPFGSAAYLAWLPQKTMPAKMRAFIDFFVAAAAQ